MRLTDEQTIRCGLAIGEILKNDGSSVSAYSSPERLAATPAARKSRPSRTDMTWAKNFAKALI